MSMIDAARRNQHLKRLAYGLVLAATAFLTLTIAPQGISFPTTDPEKLATYGMANSAMPYALLGSFLTGVLAWRPAQTHRPVVDTIWVIFMTIGLSFWMIGLVAGVSALLHGIGSNGISFLLVGPVGAWAFGASAWGPPAYLIGGTFIVPLRWIDRRTGQPISTLSRNNPGMSGPIVYGAAAGLAGTSAFLMVATLLGGLLRLT